MIYEVFGKLPKWAIQNSNLWPLPCESNGDGSEMPQNAGRNDAEADAMHLWMHLITENDQQTVVSVWLETIAETLGNDALDRVTAALAERAKHAASERQASE